MPRTIQLEYEDAFYHVMNRGKARKTISHDKRYYHSFITTLVEAHQRFGVEAVFLVPEESIASSLSTTDPHPFLQATAHRLGHLS